MIVLRDAKQLTQGRERQPTAVSSTHALLIAVLADVLQQHFQALSEDGNYDPDAHGYIVIAEPGDSVTTLETETGCPILTDWFHDSRYGDDDFAPAFEWLDEQLCCYEMGYTLNDNGFTVLLIVPKLTGIDAQLLAMCRKNACEKID